MSTPLRYTRTELATRLATLALLAAVAALLTGRAAVLVLAAPPLVLLVLGRRTDRPSTVQVTVERQPPRAVENDEVAVELRIQLPRPAHGVQVTLRTAHPIVGPEPPTRSCGVGHSMVARYRLRPDRWGRWSLGEAHLSVRAPGGLWQADLAVPLGDVIVYPKAPLLHRPPRPERLRPMIGDHVVAAKGAGVEFAGVRPYQSTDPARLVHWAATARHGRPYVVERHAERLADVVMVIDAHSDVGPPGGSSLDVSVRAAAGLATSWLGAGDRVGVVALGGALRWLPPGLGRRYLYRISDAIMEVRHDGRAVSPGLRRVPAAALPPGALVTVFTPLLDGEIVRVIEGLAERGTAILVLDTLTCEPEPDSAFPGGLALRVWRQERQMLRRRLAGLGARTVTAHDLSTLDSDLEPVRRHRPGGSSR